MCSLFGERDIKPVFIGHKHVRGVTTWRPPSEQVLGGGDPTPWQLGVAVVAPSLVVHLVYGITVALAWAWRPHAADRGQ